MAQHTITELLTLLDPSTLQTLTDRLHAVAEAHSVPTDPNQLLFDLIDGGLAAFEDEINDPKVKNLAVEILEQIEV